jgi:hypothetical protein
MAAALSRAGSGVLEQLREVLGQRDSLLLLARSRCTGLVVDGHTPAQRRIGVY